MNVIIGLMLPFYFSYASIFYLRELMLEIPYMHFLNAEYLAFLLLHSVPTTFFFITTIIPLF